MITIFYAWLFFSSKILKFSEIELGMQTKLGKNRLICFQRGRTNVSKNIMEIKILSEIFNLKKNYLKRKLDHYKTFSYP